MGLLELEPNGPSAQEVRPNHFLQDRVAIPLSGFAILGSVQYAKSIVEVKKLNQGDREKDVDNAYKFRLVKP